MEVEGGRVEDSYLRVTESDQVVKGQVRNVGEWEGVVAEGERLGKGERDGIRGVRFETNCAEERVRD